MHSHLIYEIPTKSLDKLENLAIEALNDLDGSGTGREYTEFIQAMTPDTILWLIRSIRSDTKYGRYHLRD